MDKRRYNTPNAPFGTQRGLGGVPVEVVRKRIRRINIRVAADGTVCLSVPKW